MNETGVFAMLKIMSKLWKSEKGATAIEYGLIVALISIAAIVAFQALGDSLSLLFGSLSSSVDAVSASSP